MVSWCIQSCLPSAVGWNHTEEEAGKLSNSGAKQLCHEFLHNVWTKSLKLGIFSLHLCIPACLK